MSSKASKFVPVCCVCNKQRIENGTWVPYKATSNGQVSHTYCPNCCKEVMEQIDKE